MIKGKRGNIFFGVFIALIVYIFGILFLPFVTDDITTSRTDLDCSNVSISDVSKINCLSIDLVTPYIIWLLISLALGFIAGGLS